MTFKFDISFVQFQDNQRDVTKFEHKENPNSNPKLITPISFQHESEPTRDKKTNNPSLTEIHPLIFNRVPKLQSLFPFATNLQQFNPPNQE